MEAHSGTGALRGADAVILDCDGVLADVSASYDSTIALTVARLLGELGVRARLDVDRRLIEGFKATGGFNDEVDLAYAAVLCAVAAGASGRGARGLASGVCASIGHGGIAEVERRLAPVADIAPAVRDLGHPGAGSRVRAAFDRIFYGPALRPRLFGAGEARSARGMVESDALIVDVATVRLMRGAAGRRPAVVTGRGRDAFEHTFREPLRSGFDLAASAFLEDEPRRLAKPSPEALVGSIRGIGCARAVYVRGRLDGGPGGAARAGCAVAFCGVTGTAADPAARRLMFERAGADATVRSVADVAPLLRA